jgi:hypothetical protein
VDCRNIPLRHFENDLNTRPLIIWPILSARS